MEIYDQMGLLVLGSRLKRLSQGFQNDIKRIYKMNGVDFELSWFPIFYLLKEKGAVTISALSQELQVSHSAIIQVVNILLQKDLIKTEPHGFDQRKKILTFTLAGQKRLKTVQPIWDKINVAMDALLKEGILTQKLMEVIKEYECLNDNKNLFDRYKEL